MYHFTLCTEREAFYQNRIKSITQVLERINEKWKISFDILDLKTLSPSQVEKIKNDVRNIPPQIRGKIVSARNKVLPLSRSKNLNTVNTPILLLYHNEEALTVYPHLLGTAYFEIEPQLENILENGPEAYMTAKGLLEKPIQKLLADDPSFLEEGMRFKDANLDVGFGVADVLLQDSEGRMVIVEIETRAVETAVAQTARLAAGYASQNRISQKSLRKMILCQHFDERAAKACKGADVELYRLTTKKVC